MKSLIMDILPIKTEKNILIEIILIFFSFFELKFPLRRYWIPALLMALVDKYYEKYKHKHYVNKHESNVNSNQI